MFEMCTMIIGGIMAKRVIGVDERVGLLEMIPLSIQHLFAMFGASILVPIIFGIDPAIVLFMNGLGTLLFIFITKGKAPAYLGSSFAFIAPTTLIISRPGLGYEYALGAFIFIGLIGCLISFIIYKFGTRWIQIILPPAAMGPVVALIGLELASFTVGGGAIGANLMSESTSSADIIVFSVTLGLAVFGSVLFKKFFAVIPILIAMIGGYITAVCFGMVDFTAVIESTLFSLPTFTAPKFSMQAIFIMLPVILVIVSEHIGHQVVTGKIIGRDLIKDPGLHRSLFADNLSSAISGMIGSVPTTTYGENIGVMAITGVYSVRVIALAAVFSILMAFIGPLSAFISTIPGNVIGGVTFLLYGMIGASGIRLLVDQKVDYSKTTNLILTSVIFVAGLSGLIVKIGVFEVKGMTLASLTAVILSVVFYLCRKFKWINE